LIAYLYDDIDPAARGVFDAHLAGCEHCRAELEALGGVRTTLARWNPPEPKSLAAANPQSATRNPQWWRTIPAWAQVAAALLFLGVSAGIANLDVRYDRDGLAIRTGWSKQAAQSAQRPAATEQIGVASQSGGGQGFSPASKADLEALERQLRIELRSLAATPAVAVTRPAASDAEILRKVRALIDDTERRQQRELALRLAQAITDVNAQRQADLRKIDVSLNGVQNSLGVEVLKQRQSLNYLMRVNQRQ
jgi:anti-sigma factor RsiW